MVMNKDFVKEMITYMKENRELTIAEKCKALGISVPGYYKACRRFDLDGKIRQGRSRLDIENARRVMAYARELKNGSGTVRCNQAQDSLE